MPAMLTVVLLLVASASAERVAVSADGSVAASGGLTVDNVNPRVLAAQYAVRGEILVRANELERELAAGNSGLPFDQIVKCNIGNPQALGQAPLTFTRQVLSLTMNPALFDSAAALTAFAPDAVERAQRYLAEVPSVGAYSSSQGVAVVRREVADFITARDGAALGAADPEAIFLTNGASAGVEAVMKLMLRDANDAVLVPIPQYPLYSALTTLLGGHFAGYEMTESGGWDFNLKTVEAALAEARSLGKTPRALVVINPGNPTGNSLEAESLREIVRFCAREGLVLLADEVYQENVYNPSRPFFSFRKILRKMAAAGPDSADAQLVGPGGGERLQMVSFHSISKGFTGECGLRGGYLELHGINSEVKAQLYKLVSIGLCSNVPGQLAVGLMVRPPALGEHSHDLYASERDATLGSLKRRATKLTVALNSLTGVTCNPAEGAMYAFPEIDLPAAFAKEAAALGKAPDALYALNLLEATGIVVVPGSGFGQRAGSWHFRTTFLPPEDTMDGVIERMTTFQNAFVAKYPS